MKLLLKKLSVTRAIHRGFQRGYDEAESGLMKNDFPLSGEWASESINELLGDLLKIAGDDEHGHEVCMAYEDGYSNGYDLYISEQVPLTFKD